jgi:hypothetical protein
VQLNPARRVEGGQRTRLARDVGGLMAFPSSGYDAL